MFKQFQFYRPVQVHPMLRNHNHMSSKFKPFKQLLLINFSSTGREQVSVGVVPMMEAVGKGLGGAQSALAVIPIAIANCAGKKRFCFSVISHLFVLCSLS